MTGGDKITLISSIFFAINIVSISLFCQDRDPIIVTFLQVAIASICSWICVFLIEGLPKTVSMGAIGSLLYLGVFCSAVCMSLQSIGLKYVNPTVGTIILSLESVFGVLASVILYQEVVTPRMLLGFIVIFIAIILSQLNFGRKNREIQQEM